MDHLAVLASVFAVHLLATISPRPNFAAVTLAALNQSRGTGVVFFGAIFAALLTPALPAWVPLVAMLIVFANALLWYVAVAYFFSAQATRARYRRFKGRIDKVVGGVLMLMGVRLMMPTR